MADNRVEKLRTYHFYQKNKPPIMIKNVDSVINRKQDGVHEIKTSTKKKYFILPGWYYIEIELE